MSGRRVSAKVRCACDPKGSSLTVHIRLQQSQKISQVRENKSADCLTPFNASMIRCPLLALPLCRYEIYLPFV